MRAGFKLLAILAAGLQLLLPTKPVEAQALRRGGDLVIGINSPIPSLDIMGTTDDVGRIINLHLYEALVTRNEKLEPSAGLAESWEVSPDGLTYTFKLRHGVKFHNGRAMTALDVKASIDRYRRMSLRRRYVDKVENVTVIDPFTVSLQLKSAQPLFMNNFSQPEVLIAILPAEDGDKDPGRTSMIGTGPYKLVENMPDGYIKLARFEDYALDTRYPGRDGYGGRKDALFDTITFRIIPEASAMVAALEAGEILAADWVPELSVPSLKRNPKLNVVTVLPSAMQILTVNMAEPPMDNLALRRAIEAALDMDEIMAAATDGNYRLNPYLQYPGYALYPTDVRAPRYNLRDKAQLQRMVQQAGYKGETIRILSASTFAWHSNAALVISEQLKAAGIKTEIVSMDWPAIVTLRAKSAGWHLLPNRLGTGPWLGDPLLAIGGLIGNTVATTENHVVDQELIQLASEMELQTSAEARKAAWLKAQERILDQVLQIKIGDIGQSQVTNKRLGGFAPFRTTRLWGVGFVD